MITFKTDEWLGVDTYHNIKNGGNSKSTTTTKFGEPGMTGRRLQGLRAIAIGNVAFIFHMSMAILFTWVVEYILKAEIPEHTSVKILETSRMMDSD